MQNSAEFSWDSDDITDCLLQGPASSGGSLLHTCIKPLFLFTHPLSLGILIYLSRISFKPGSPPHKALSWGRGPLQPARTPPCDFILEVISFCWPPWPPRVTCRGLPGWSFALGWAGVWCSLSLSISGVWRCEYSSSSVLCQGKSQSHKVINGLLFAILPCILRHRYSFPCVWWVYHKARKGRVNTGTRESTRESF